MNRREFQKMAVGALFVGAPSLDLDEDSEIKAVNPLSQIVPGERTFETALDLDGPAVLDVQVQYHGDEYGGANLRLNGEKFEPEYRSMRPAGVENYKVITEEPNPVIGFDLVGDADFSIGVSGFEFC